MNASYRWIKDLVPGLTLSAEEVASHLALRGAPVEEMVSPGTGLGDVVVGKVLTSGPHPNADRLSLCTVDGGSGVVQVVCGAPNVKAGAWYPFAPVGAVLPGDFKLKKAKIRGEHSEGMLCSAKELGLGTDHAGIMEIHGDFTPGEPFVRAMGLDDVTLDVEITANRGDLLSHLGIARELAAEGDGETRLPDLPGDPGVTLAWEEGASDVRVGDVGIRIEDPDLCSRYLGAVIRGVEIGPSPAWLQERLRGAGARPINNVVDATNYVMLELGQPLHAFDLRNLAGSSIVVRRARPEEKRFTTLDDEERAITPDMLMICDAERPVAVAGVMGGQDSEVSGDTTDVLLECALFEPKSIRATRRALVMSTDASYRFERGVDPAGLRRAVERAVALILATAGGSVDGPVLDVCARPFSPATVSLRLARIERVLGVPLEADVVRGYLEPLGFAVRAAGEDVLEVEVPGFRSYDVTREIDLIEEVARAHGYDRFPEELGAYRPNTVPDHPMFQLEDELRAVLVGRGFFEAQTPAFVPEGEGDVRVANPLNTREPFIRRTVLPSLLRRVEHNFARGRRDVRLFEIATSFRREASGAPPAEENHLAVVLTGRREPPHWSVPEELVSLWDVKGLLETVAVNAYRGRSVSVLPAPDAQMPFDAEACFVVVDDGGAEVGRGGRVADGVVDAPIWADDVWGIELTLPSDVPATPVPIFVPLPQHPAVERDLALLVPDGVAARVVADVIRARGGELLEDVSLFDHYRGEGVPEGHRSVAFGLRFRARERTLKDKEVDRAVDGIVGRLKEELGVERRG
ncbi:MAG: phenylalanine--tRNA ligase subunit beta [Gemmatimonadota bacterium]|jgi:phenylalanyl-tRNA synthetase beta chain